MPSTDSVMSCGLRNGCVLPEGIAASLTELASDSEPISHTVLLSPNPHIRLRESLLRYIAGVSEYCLTEPSVMLTEYIPRSVAMTM